jgi:hypothetical protein
MDSRANKVRLKNLDKLFTKKHYLFEITKSHLGFYMEIEEYNLERSYIEESINKLISISRLI